MCLMRTCYYVHLDSYAEGLRPGQIVELETLIG
jgi:hypothetical protein